MYINSKSKSKEPNKKIKIPKTCIRESGNNIFTDYNYKYVNDLKMEKIKQEIRDYIIDKYITIIMKQNNEIILLKSKIEKLLNKSNKLFKAFNDDQNNINNFQNKKYFSKTYLDNNNSSNDNNENIRIKNIYDKSKKEKNPSNTNITYLKELNKKDMKKIDYIHRKILSTKSFQDIFDNINSNITNNIFDYANTLNMTNDSIESFNSKKKNNMSFFTNFNIPNNAMSKIKMRIPKNKETIKKKLGKSCLNGLNQTTNVKNLKKKNTNKKNNFKFYDQFKILNNSLTCYTTENFYPQNKENDNCFSNINDINIEKRKSTHNPKFNTYLRRRNTNS